MKKTIILLTIISLTYPIFLLSAEQNGKLLYSKANCQQCHGFGEDFHRYKNKIQNKSSLLERVTGCTKHFKANWDNFEIEEVTEYLNNTQYKFDKQ
jgi:hypothetical protein